MPSEQPALGCRSCPLHVPSSFILLKRRVVAQGRLQGSRELWGLDCGELGACWLLDVPIEP